MKIQNRSFDKIFKLTKKECFLFGGGWGAELCERAPFLPLLLLIELS